MKRNPTDLRDPKSFDHVGRDAGANQFTFGTVLADLADHDERIVTACADLKYVTHLADFEQRHPRRFLQFGIAERNMISAAAGLATCGLLPYVATFASFSAILCFENIKTDLAYPGLPVRVLGTHCGISLGFFGTSHHATEDIAALRAVPGLTVLSASDNLSLELLLRETVDVPGPIYFRVGRGAEAPLYEQAPEGYGQRNGHRLAQGDDVLVVSTGVVTRFALDAVAALEREGVSATLLDLYRLKPLDAAALARVAAEHRAVVTVEEHNVEGGLGTIVQEAVAGSGIQVPVYKHGLYDEYGIIGPPSHLYRYYGLDPGGIAQVVQRVSELVSAGKFYLREPESLWTDDDRRQVVQDVRRTRRTRG